MKFFSKLLFYLMPDLMLKNTSRELVWKQLEKQRFILTSKIFYSIIILAYIGHYYFVDVPLGKKPIELWWNYRFGVATLASVTLLFYFTKWSSSMRWYRIPSLLVCTLLIYLQTQTLMWKANVPYFYSFVFIIIGSLILQMKPLSTFFFVAINYVLMWPILIQTETPVSTLVSAMIVTFITVIIIKTRYLIDIELFLAHQRNIDDQQKIIELNNEYTNQIRSFLPKEIAHRLNTLIKVKKLTPIQAIDRVLRPQRRFITCLFSDVRGFTQGSMDLDGYVSQSLFPNIRISTESIENYHGIPRKVGDLILAYFDHEDPKVNISRALQSALELQEINRHHNHRLNDHFKINRYILISGGEAIVGNLSSYESSVEVTAIGRPINLLSRLDEITKSPDVAALLEQGDIILPPEFARILHETVPGLELTLIPIFMFNLAVRDFLEIKDIYVLPPTRKNKALIKQLASVDETFQDHYFRGSG